MEYLVTAILRETSGTELQEVEMRASRFGSYRSGSWHDGTYSAKFEAQHDALQYISWLLGNNSIRRASIERK